MIPILFESTYPTSQSIFSGHGLGDLVDAYEIIAEESADDDGHEWELTFKYPENGDMANDLTFGRIVLVKANSYQNPQAFRIYSVTKAINHVIEVACQHISYDLANIPVKPMTVIGPGPALVQMKTNMLNVCNRDNFTFTTDISIEYSSAKTYNIGDLATYYGTLYKCKTAITTPEAWNSSHWTDPSSAEKKSVTIEFDEPMSALKVLIDGDGSIKGEYGGDLVCDNYSIYLKQVGGQDRGEEISYGMDLVDLDQERNITNMITGIYPYYVRAKDTRLDVGIERQSDVTEVGGVMALNSEAYTLEVGSKYTLKFTPENSGGTALLNSSAGFGSQTFSMDGLEKEYEITPGFSMTVAAGTSLITAVTLPSHTVTEGGQTITITDMMGSINSFSITKNYVEPIIYGDIVNGPGTYDVPRISPINLTEYFQDTNNEPTPSQITAKGQEYLNKEEIGQPEVSLTVSYATLENKDVRLYDAVRVKFVKMGIDVKSKVTRYKYDVLAERCTEIDVGKTKDSAVFTLQDASRLRRGLLPPDRIAKESIDGNKIKKGSIGGSQIGTGSIGKWNMPVDIIDEDLLGEKAVSVRNLKVDDGSLPDGWCKDPVLKTVPDDVYGGYHKKVGYLFDPSMGVPPDNLCGWTYTTPQGDRVFKSILKQGTAQEWQQKIPYDQGSGVGYVLDPDCFFKNDIHGNHLKDGTVNTQQISDGAIDENKLSSIVDPSTGRKNLKSKITAWENLHDNLGPEMETWYEATVEGSSYITMPYLSVSHQLYITNNDIAMVGPSAQYGSYHFRPNKLKLNIGGSGASDLGVFLIAGGSDITIDVSSIASNASGALDSLNTLTCRLYGGTDYHFHQYYGDLNTIHDTLADHENRIAALEANS